MKTNNILQALVLATLVGTAGTAAAASSVSVSYTLTGTAGDWLLDFDVANGLVGSDQSVYFVGVAVAGGAVTNDPVSFSSTAYPTWSYNAYYGGSSLEYNGVWVSGGHVILPGDSQSGFLVHSDAIAAPTLVNWFAFSSGSEYLGSGFFNNGFNPGWEGVASADAPAAVVPEPANIALLLAGLGLVGGLARRRGAAR